MTQPLLQNHPCSQQFPAHHSQLLESRAGSKLFLFAALLECFLVILSIIFLILWPIIEFTDSLNWHYDAFKPIANSIWMATGIGFITVIILHRWKANRPIREQKRYYRLTNTDHLSHEKRQALALDLFDVYRNGFWSETLEPLPQAWRVGGYESQFKTMPLLDSNDSIKFLKESWGITSTESAKSIIEQLLSGMDTSKFATIIKSDPYLVYNTLEKLQYPKEAALEISNHTFNSIDSYPPQLIWGFDLWRAISVARSAFSAQYLTMDEAWDYILRASSLAFEIFPNRDAFYNSLFLGCIFWGHDAQVENTIDAKNAYQACEWPVKSLPWNPRGNMVLTANIKTGFGIVSDIIPSMDTH